MWIGEQRISLRNMSKNQRNYWRQLKRIYDEAISDGFHMSGQEFIESYAPYGRITSLMAETLQEETSETLLGYDREFEKERAFIDNLISDLSYVNPTTRRGRTRHLSYGEQIKLALARKLEALVQQYNYKIVYGGWMSMPYEIRANIDSANAADRYKAYEAALGIIEGLVSDYASSHLSYYDDVVYDDPEE